MIGKLSGIVSSIIFEVLTLGYGFLIKTFQRLENSLHFISTVTHIHILHDLTRGFFFFFGVLYILFIYLFLLCSVSQHIVHH